MDLQAVFKLWRKLRQFSEFQMKKICSSDPLAKHDFCHIVNEPLGDYLIILRNFIIFLGTFSFLQTLFLSGTIPS